MKKIIIPIISILFLISNKAHACLASSWIDTKPALTFILYPLYIGLSYVAPIVIILFLVALPISIFSKKEKIKRFSKITWKISLFLFILNLLIWFIIQIPSPSATPCF